MRKKLKNEITYGAVVGLISLFAANAVIVFSYVFSGLYRYTNNPYLQMGATGIIACIFLYKFIKEKTFLRYWDGKR